MKKKYKTAAVLISIFIFTSCSAAGEDILPASVTYENTVTQAESVPETLFESIPETAAEISETTVVSEISSNESKTEVGSSFQSETEVKTEVRKEPETITVSVCAAGDNLIHSPIYAQAESRANAAGLGDKYDFDYAYSNIKDLISSYDLAMINQETLICNDIYEPSNYPYFNSPAALGDYMIKMGFKVFSVANNHTLDQGTEGLSACLDFWESRTNVLAVGAYRNKADRADIRINEINGIKFSYLSYTEHLNGLSLPRDSELEIGDAKNIAVMAEEIEQAKMISDVCVVFLHWGIEGYDEIEPFQRSTAQILVKSGADIIIGTHPHVLRDIEYIERHDGTRAVCAYSLGNFISAQNIPQTMIGGVLAFDIVLVPETREINIKNTVFIPTVTHYDENYRNLRIYKLSDYTEELADFHGIRTRGEFSLEYARSVVKNSINREFLKDYS